jgi:hypothetical protein
MPPAAGNRATQVTVRSGQFQRANNDTANCGAQIIAITATYPAYPWLHHGQCFPCWAWILHAASAPAHSERQPHAKTHAQKFMKKVLVTAKETRKGPILRSRLSTADGARVSVEPHDIFHQP